MLPPSDRERVLEKVQALREEVRAGEASEPEAASKALDAIREVEPVRAFDLSFTAGEGGQSWVEAYKAIFDTFIENPKGSVRITTAGHTYELTFAEFFETYREIETELESEMGKSFQVVKTFG